MSHSFKKEVESDEEEDQEKVDEEEDKEVVYEEEYKEEVDEEELKYIQELLEWEKAAREGNLENLQVLRTQYKGILPTNLPEMALVQASEEHQIHVIQWLLDSFPSIETHAAMSVGVTSVEVTRLLLSYGATSIDHSLAMVACLDAPLETAALLVARGANVDQGLTEACGFGRLPMAQLMIQLGATKWKYAWECACENKHRDCALLLLQQKIQPLTDVDIGGRRLRCQYRRDWILFFLENGIDVKRFQRVVGMPKLTKELQSDRLALEETCKLFFANIGGIVNIFLSYASLL